MASVDVRVARVQELQHLALGDDVGGVGQDLQHTHAVDRHHELERPRIEEIADQHARRVAEHRVGRRVAAAQRGLVDDVVVEQRRGMDHLDDGGDFVMLRAAVTASRRCEEHQGRPQPLAAAGDDVFGDLADQDDVGGEALAQNPIHGVQVIAQNRLEQRDDHGRGF